MAAALLLAACRSDGGSKSETADAGARRDPDSTAAASTPVPQASGASLSGTGTPGAAATATALPGAALTPRPAAPSDLASARGFEAEGDLTAAADAYIAVAAKNTAERGEAVLGAARVLLELERPADVRILLEPFVPGATGREVAARYMLARAYAALSMWNESLEQYNAYIQSGRPGLPYAYLDRSRIQVELNQPGAAGASAQSGLVLGVPGSSRRTFLLAIAQASERAGSLGDAIRGYNAFIEGSDSSSDKALGLSRVVAIKRQQGDPTYTAELKRLLADYPSTAQALKDLNDALGRGEPIDPTIRGLIYYRNNDYTKAQPAFQEQINNAPNSQFSAEAYYYLAAILESKGDNNGAMSNYERVLAVNPASGVADDALWWRARILEDDSKLDEARALYARIANEYSASSWGPEAAFRRGMLSYRANKYGEAATIWADGATAAAPAERQRLTLWQAKSLQKAGSDAAAKPLLEQLASVNEDDYYGVRAVSLLRNKHEQPKSTRESKVDFAPKFDWPGAEAWLSQRTGRPVTDAAWSTDNRWARAQELWLLGRSSQGDAEAFDLLEAYARDPISMYTMSRMLAAQGRVGMAGRAGQRLLRVLDTNPNGGLPRELLSLSYPPAFGASAQKYAQNERISPLLLLAFVRQESFFDPRAESPAGALGLTQVLPSTGKTVAEKLGAGAVTDEQLLHADLNLRLGANYMSEQLRSFGNEIFTAFAGYNAGPNAAKRWRNASGPDADAFLETVEYKESRLYVQFVAENYAIYRYLYGGESVPNLPD